MYFLTITASDTCSAAGIQQDLKMAQINKFWGLNVITAITSQNFQRVDHMDIVDEKLFRVQLETIFLSFPISAIKIGVVPSKTFACILGTYLEKIKCPVVYDPVIKSTSGFMFSMDDPKDIYSILAPFCTVTTPNIPEYQYLFGTDISKLSTHENMENHRHLKEHDGAIYIKGGHGTQEHIIEYLMTKEYIKKYEYKKQMWKFYRGTGCAFSSLLSMFLVDNNIENACKLAREVLVKYYEGYSPPIIN